MIQVQLIPNDPTQANIPVEVPENPDYPEGDPAPVLVIYKDRYFSNYSSGYGVVPPSYREIDGPAFVVL